MKKLILRNIYIKMKTLNIMGQHKEKSSSECSMEFKKFDLPTIK